MSAGPNVFSAVPVAKDALAGLVIGAVGVQAIHAQAPSQTVGPAFYISEFEITDPEAALKPYRERVDATFAPFSGRYVVRGGEIASLEAERTHRRDQVRQHGEGQSLV
jgi:hypothetical protein